MAHLDVNFGWEPGSLEAAFAVLERECTNIIRGLTVQVWDSILLRTPQYAGGMVASWTYSLNAPQFYDRSDFVDSRALAMGNVNTFRSVNPRSRGDLAAISIADGINVGREQAFRLGDMVYISNGVDHGEGPYAYDVESGAVRLRAANLPGRPVSLTLDRIGARYGQDISPYTAARLKSLRIGGISAESDS